MNIGLEKIVKTEITARRGLQVSALRAGVKHKVLKKLAGELIELIMKLKHNLVLKKIFRVQQKILQKFVFLIACVSKNPALDQTALQVSPIRFSNHCVHTEQYLEMNI